MKFLAEFLRFWYHMHQNSKGFHLIPHMTYLYDIQWRSIGRSIPLKEFVACRVFPSPLFLFFAFREACFISYTMEGSQCFAHGFNRRQDRWVLKKDLSSEWSQDHFGMRSRHICYYFYRERYFFQGTSKCRKIAQCCPLKTSYIAV